MTVCERMFKIMEEKGIKAIKLAEKLNISQSVISNWKKRNTNPPIEYTLDICEVLNVSVYRLLGYEEIEFNEQEKQLLEYFRKCNKGNKEIILNAAKSLKENDKEQEKSSTLRIG